MNRVLLYINEVLVSLDIPPIVKTTERRLHNLPRRKSKSTKEISKDNIK
ncbi:hypothetical protein [Pontimicrobium sp. MEBiC01747]|jgi:hypothetical protein